MTRSSAAVMTKPAPAGLGRELDSAAASLVARYPEADPAEIRTLVSTTYEQPAATARIRTHLIPLTLDRCRRVLSERWGCHRVSATTEMRDL